MSKKRLIVLLCLVVCLVFSATALLSACAKEATYKVSYAKGNSAATGTVPEAKSYKKGDKVTVANNPFTLTDYTFNGWSDGTTTYKEGDTFTMPAKDVTLTAQWKEQQSLGGGDACDNPDCNCDNCTGDDCTCGDVVADEPTLAELPSDVYDADNWVYMTNNSGASLDGGDKTYALNDGSVKFHRANQAVELDEKLTKASLMLKATGDFAIWFNSSSKDNASNYSYRLVYGYSELRLVISSASEQAAARVTSTYKKGEWNRIDIEFNEKEDSATGRTICEIKLYVNGERATLAAGDNTTQVTVANNVLTHTQVGNFATGSWLVAKVWEADNYLQIKPVANKDIKDVPIVAAIGASITEGAGASNFYTESYPAQLQNALGGAYNVINYGKSGRTVRTDTGVENDGTPVPWLENRQWKGVQAIVPDIAIINMGTNDSKTSLDPVSTYETFKAAYEHLIAELLNVNSDMRIIACTVPTAYSGIYDINDDNIKNIIAPAIRDIANASDTDNIELVDLYDITQNKSLLFGDGVHPGTTGYAMFAEVFKKVILEGVDALTSDFLADIDARYNDPDYVLDDIQATLAVVGEEIRLTVTGYIEITDTSKLRLELNTDKAGQQVRSVPITLQDNGTFSVTMRIDDLTGTDWYIVRVYLTETFAHIVTLDETTHTENQVFATAARKVTVVQWSNRFNLKIQDNVKVEDVSVAIVTTDGYTLTISGKTNAESLRLFVGVHATEEGKWREFIPVTPDQDGSFSVVYNLENLFKDATIVSDYVNVRLYFGETTSYYPVSWQQTTIDGVAAAVGKSFNMTDKTVTIASYGDGGVPTLSFVVSPYDPTAPTAQVTGVSFDDGKFIVVGTVDGAVTTLKVAIVDKDDSIAVTLQESDLVGGTFTVQLDLSLMQHGNGNWYYLEITVNEGDATRQSWGELTGKDATHTVGQLEYYFASAGNIAVVRRNVTPTVRGTITVDDGGAITLSVTGTFGDTLTLYIGKNENTQRVPLTFEGNNFSGSVNLLILGNDSWYNIRLYYSNNTDYYEVRLNELTYNGTQVTTSTEIIGNGKKITFQTWSDYNPSAFTIVDYNEATPTLNATSITFDNQYLVVEGVVSAQVDSLVLALHNDNDLTDNIKADATFTDLAFVAKIDLTQLTLTGGQWFYLWSSINGEDETKVQYEKNSTTHIWGNRIYRFENWQGIAVAFDAYTPPSDDVVVTSATLVYEEGKLTLSLAGTTTDEALFLRISDGNGKDFDKNVTYTDGNFTVEYDLLSVEISGDWYNVRLYLSDWRYYAVSYTQITIGGDALQKEREFTGADRKIIIKSWEDKNCINNPSQTLSMQIVEYTPPAATDPIVAVSGVRFDSGNLVVNGTVANVNHLYVYLINTNVADSTTNYVEATITESTFEVSLSLSTLIGFAQNSTPFNLRYKIDSLEVGTANVVKGELDITQVYVYNGKTFTFGINGGCVAVYYKTTTTAVIANYVGFDGDTLVIKATVTGEYETIKFYVNNTASGTEFELQKDISVQEDGTFELRIDLSEFESAASGAYLNLRVSFNGNTSLVGMAQGQSDLSATHQYDGRNYSFGINGSTVYIKYANA